MHYPGLVILCGLVIVTGLLAPAAGAVDPLWTEAATTHGELSAIVISADGSTIVAGGDQLIALSPDGRKRWTGWSGNNLAISRDGKYILASREQTLRMISGSGTLLWDITLEVPVRDMSMVPDASLIAACGGSRMRIISASGATLKQNSSALVNHIRLFPKGDQVVMTSRDGIARSNLTLYSEWADTNMSQDFVEVAADGSSFVSVTNNRIRMYTRDGKLQWDRGLPGGNALAFAYSRDGSTIVAGMDDTTVHVLDRGGTLLWTACATYWITSVAVSDDGNTVVAGSMDRTLSVYDRAGTNLGSFTADNPIKARSVAVSGDGSVIAAVDASAVYGFSRSQFTGPEITPVPSTPATATTQVSVTASAATPAPPGTMPATTRQAAVPVGIPLAGLVLIILCLSRHT